MKVPKTALSSCVCVSVSLGHLARSQAIISLRARPVCKPWNRAFKLHKAQVQRRKAGETLKPQALNEPPPSLAAQVAPKTLLNQLLRSMSGPELWASRWGAMSVDPSGQTTQFRHSLFVATTNTRLAPCVWSLPALYSTLSLQLPCRHCEGANFSHASHLDDRMLPNFWVETFAACFTEREGFPNSTATFLLIAS